MRGARTKKRRTPRDIARMMRTADSAFETTDIRLACGVVVPRVPIEVSPESEHWTKIGIGDDTTGSVEFSFWWTGDAPPERHLRSVELDAFFYTNHKVPSFEAALLEASGGRTMAQVFMLMIDEIVFWTMELYGAVPGCAIELEDVAHLQSATPFALWGRAPIRAYRNSRFLQYVRGAAYYVAYGFWPRDEQPRDYLNRVARYARPGVAGAVPGEPQYARLIQAARSHESSDDYVKRLPPVLPPTTPGGELRRFESMQDYFERVLVPGTYGRAIYTGARAVAAPPEGTPAESPLGSPGGGSGGWQHDLDSPDSQEDRDSQDSRDSQEDDWESSDDSDDSDDATLDILETFRSGGRTLEPGAYDGVDAPSGGRMVGTDRLTQLRLGPYGFLFQLAREPPELVGPVALIIGPLVRVGAVARLAARLGRAVLGPECKVVWRLPEGPLTEIAVGGTVVESRSDRRFRPPGVDRLVAAGFVPLRAAPQQVPRLLTQARRCDRVARGRLIGESHPQFGACLQVATALGQHYWVWAATGAAARTAQTPAPSARRAASLP